MMLEQRALAAARRPQQTHELAFPDIDRHVVERDARAGPDRGPANIMETRSTAIAGALRVRMPRPTRLSPPLELPPAITSELHRNELVVVDRLRVRDRSRGCRDP